MDACQHHNVIPNGEFREALADPEVGCFSVGAAFQFATEKDLLAVFQALAVNHTIKHLSLDALIPDQLGSSVMNALVAALSKNTHLRSISLCHCQLDDARAALLFSVFSTNKTLSEVHLRDNVLTGKSLKSLPAPEAGQPHPLQTLDIRGNAGIKKDASVAKELAKFMGSISVLRLDIEGAKLGPLLLAVKKKNHLRDLIISETALPINIILSLCDHLATSSVLTSLSLPFCWVGERGGLGIAGALMANEALTFLDLSHNAIGTKAGEILSEALRKNNTLTSLNLCENELTDATGYYLACALSENQVLTSMDISSNPLGEQGALALLEGLRRNQSLLSLGPLATLPVSLTLRGALELALDRAAQRQVQLMQMHPSREEKIAALERMLQGTPANEQRLRRQIFRLEDQVERLEDRSARQESQILEQQHEIAQLRKQVSAYMPVDGKEGKKGKKGGKKGSPTK